MPRREAEATEFQLVEGPHFDEDSAMPDQGVPPNTPEQKRAAAPVRGRFPWSLVVVPLLIAAVIYVTTQFRGASVDEASLRLRVTEFIVGALPGSAPAEVTILTVEPYRDSANVSGTAVATEFSGQKQPYEWHLTMDSSSGEWKATEWKLTPSSRSAAGP